MSAEVSVRGKIRVGLIGCGRIGRAHAIALKGTDGRLVAVADVEPTRAADFSREFRVSAFATTDELIASAEIDAVIIAVPTNLHAALTMAAAAAGKHILCEKPMAMTTAEADGMISAARRAGVVLMVGHNLRFSLHCRAAERAVREGRIGIPRSLAAERLAGAQATTWRNWVTQAGEGLGAFDALIHDLDLARWMLGPATSLVAHAVRGPRGTWEEIQVLVDYRSEVRAVIAASLMVPPSFPFTSSLRIVGDDATLARRFVGGRSYREPGSDTGLILFPRSGEPEVLVGPTREESEGSLLRELEEFIASVRAARAPDLGRPEDARAALELASNIERAIATAAPMALSTQEVAVVT